VLSVALPSTNGRAQATNSLPFIPESQ